MTKRAWEKGTRQFDPTTTWDEIENVFKEWSDLGKAREMAKEELEEHMEKLASEKLAIIA